MGRTGMRKSKGVVVSGSGRWNGRACRARQGKGIRGVGSSDGKWTTADGEGMTGRQKRY